MGVVLYSYAFIGVVTLLVGLSVVGGVVYVVWVWGEVCVGDCFWL